MQDRAAVILALATMLLAGCEDVRDQIPREIGITRVISSYSQGDFMGGCRYVLYALSAEAAAAIKSGGIEYVRRIPPPPSENPDNPYVGWDETPILEGQSQHIYAPAAIEFCGAVGEVYNRGIRRALQSPGSYYMLTKNGEGMILVMPDQGIAAVLYWG